MKYILITGVSSGIGFHLCKSLLEESYFVFGSVRKEEDKIRLELAFPNNFKALVFDVCQEEQIKAASQFVQEALGENTLFALINNAGIAVPGPLSEMSESSFQLQMEVNVNGVLNVTNNFIPLLKSDIRPGRIINISSVSGLLNTPFLGAYCVSKHALESMSDIYRRELDLYGIKVILIEPGPLKTDIWDKSLIYFDDFKTSEYWPYLKGMDKIIAKTEQSASDVSLISKVINKALGRKNPQLRYIVHKQKGLIYIISRFLPSSIMDFVIRKNLKKMKNSN